MKLAIAVLLASASAYAQPWTPPLGIPAPSFGVVETAGATTHTVAVGSQVPTVPAGSVVEIQPGVHNFAGRTWTLNGTQAAPIFVRGATGASVDCAGGSEIKVQGQYIVVERLLFERCKFRFPGTAPHHIALRDLEIRGWPGTSNTSIIGFPGVGSDLVVLRCHIHDNGIMTEPGESDINGVTAGGGTQRVWVLDSHIHHQRGDSVKFGESIPGSSPMVRFVYVGRNVLHDNGENGIDVKWSGDAVISENEMWAFAQSASSSGESVVVHYQAERIWIIGNLIRDAQRGVVSTGAVGLRVLGNRFARIGIGSPDPAVRAVRAYSSAGYVVAHNTIRDSHRGISLELAGRCHSNVVSGSVQAHTELTQGATCDGLLVGPEALSTIGTAPTSTTVANPLFASADPTSAALLPTSPARDAGAADAAYAEFQALYGLDISAGRPSGPAWDDGAFEILAGGGSVPAAPGTPSILVEVTP